MSAFRVEYSEEPFWGTAGAQQDKNAGADQRKRMSLVFKINVLNQELVCKFVQTIVCFVLQSQLTHNLKVVSSNLAPATKLKPTISMRWWVFFLDQTARKIVLGKRWKRNCGISTVIFRTRNLRRGVRIVYQLGNHDSNL
jgi:hypothetical protein